jgi:hypothetical protein
MGSDDGFGKPQKGPLAPLLGKATKFWKQRSMPERVALAVATVLMVCPSSVVWSKLQRDAQRWAAALSRRHRLHVARPDLR